MLECEAVADSWNSQDIIHKSCLTFVNNKLSCFCSTIGLEYWTQSDDHMPDKYKMIEISHTEGE